MAVETLVAQPAREMAEAKDQNETDNPLREFGKCAVALRHVLHQDRALMRWNSTSLITISKS